jgi:hypothetical protein
MRLDHCVACGARDALHHHHLVPRIEGGSDDDTNMIQGWTRKRIAETLQIAERSVYRILSAPRVEQPVNLLIPMPDNLPIGS